MVESPSLLKEGLGTAGAMVILIFAFCYPVFCSHSVLFVSFFKKDCKRYENTQEKNGKKLLSKTTGERKPLLQKIF